MTAHNQCLSVYIVHSLLGLTPARAETGIDRISGVSGQMSEGLPGEGRMSRLSPYVTRRSETSPYRR
jgi:hypothetical protein